MISDAAMEAFERVRTGIGDAQTREQDWETIYHTVWPILVARTSRRGLACFAPDAVQSTLLAILKEPQRLAEFASLPDFIAYCSRASLNRAIDFIRRTLRLETIEATLEPAARPQEDPMLLYVPTNLGPDERELAHAFYKEGRTYSEIAVRLGLSEREVKTRMFMLQKKLQEIAQKTA